MSTAVPPSGDGREYVAADDRTYATAGSSAAPAGRDQSIGDLISAVTSDFSTLMRQEVALAKAEAKDSATKAGKAAGMFAGAGVAGLLLLIFFSLALAWALGDLLGDSLGWGALVVAIIWAVVAAVLALQGKKELKNVGMQHTAETAAKIPDALKGNEEKA